MSDRKHTLERVTAGTMWKPTVGDPIADMRAAAVKLRDQSYTPSGPRLEYRYDLRVCQDEAARRRHQSGGGMRTVVRYSDPVTPSGRAERARARAEVENEAVRREGAVTAEREAEIRATLWRWNGYPLAHDADRAEPRS